MDYNWNDAEKLRLTRLRAVIGNNSIAFKSIPIGTHNRSLLK